MSGVGKSNFGLEPLADYAAQESRPWASNDGIVKFLEFPVRLPTISRRAFHLYWMRHHSPHVMNVTPFSQFMRKYSTGHAYPEPVAGLPDHYRPVASFEGAAEVWMNSLTEVSTWLVHPLYRELVQPDECRFIRQDGSVEVIISKEERPYEPDADLNENDLTKVYVLVRRFPDIDHDTFHFALSEYGRAMIAPKFLRRVLRKLVISHRIREPWPEGLVLADIDAVIELWFASRADLEQFFTDSVCRSIIAKHEHGCIDTGRVRAVVAKMRVIHDELSFQPSTTQPLSFSWDD
jgi:EthD domain